MQHRICNTCEARENYGHRLPDFRWAKSRHIEAAAIHFRAGSAITAAGFAYTFVRALDTHWLPQRLRLNGKINDPNHVLMELWSQRKTNTILAATFGLATVFFGRAWYHRNQYLVYKERIRSTLHTDCSNAR